MGAGASAHLSGGMENDGNIGGDDSAYDIASDEQKALMAQAQAHWRRMIIHANAVEKADGKLTGSVIQTTQKDKTNEEERIQRTIALYRQAEKNELDHKSDYVVEDFDKELNARLAPLDDETIITRSNSDIKLRRSASGEPLPFGMPKTPSIRASKSNTSLQDLLQDNDMRTKSSPKQRCISNPAPSIGPGMSLGTGVGPRPSTSSQVDAFKRQPKITSECLHAISALPPVRVDLRSRTGTSLSLVWDSDMEALIRLRNVTDRDGNQIVPRYEVTYRKAQHKNDVEALYDRSIQENKSSKWQWLELEDVTRTSGTIDKLQPNTQYCVRCRRMQWSEEWGITLTVRTGPGPPNAVEELHAKEVSSTTILVSWAPPTADNGLPVQYYVVRKKRLGGEFEEVFRGKERLYLAVDLSPNAVYVFEVVACNRVGAGSAGERLATRTLQPGAAVMTPWMEVIETDSGKLFYKHPKTNATAWVLPKGSVVDTALSLKNKIQYLRHRLKSMQSLARQSLSPSSHELKLEVNRYNLLEESLGFLRLATADELLAGVLKVTFVNETGVDGGGLSREWAVEIMKIIVSSSSGLFQMEEDGSGAVIDVRAETLHGSECRWLFAAIAKVFAKCVIDGLVLGVRFNRIFLSWLAAKPPSLEDLHAMDASMYRGLTWVLENDVTDMDLTFSASFELLGAQQTVNLVPNGASKTVTEGNKSEYVELMMAWLIRGRFEPAVTHFVESFHSVLPLHLFQHFSLSDLQLLISGSPEVNIQALQSETCYTGGYDESTSQVQWFWEIVKHDLSGEEVSSLLAFATGCPCIPHTGLKPPLTITMIENPASISNNTEVSDTGLYREQLQQENAEKRDAILPRSHTCFHQIVLPLYSTKQRMSEKLMYALKNTDGGGFHLA